MRCAALLGCSVAGSGLSACSASPAAGETAADDGGAAEAGREAGRAADAPAAGVRSADVALRRSPRHYPMKKSINLWAFPYPQRMSLQQCLELARRAGFDAIELNYDLENDLSPRASEKDLVAIRTLAEKVGIEISGLCSFLFWPYPFTASRQETRERAVELAGKMIEAAHLVGTDNLLVVPGAVYIPWIEGSEEIPYPDADRRAREAVRRLLPLAEKHEVRLNIENIFFNAYLMSPPDLIEFVDSFESPWLKVHFDTGNIMPLQFPEHWIPMLGGRIRNVHLKEFSKKGTDVSLEAFRPLLDGTTNWPAVMAALDEVGYRGYVTFEYFHPFAHYPEALIYQTSDAMDRMLGRTTA
ncbi:MAG: sugar phosphate isomerase/epimerase [Planctomycetes bacterium]|nr:sugar phosphate isomerase/epimerase [Planctomycetota bacterium]